jgi:hypothetical protein
MTIRSILLGFLGVIVLCGFTFFNDMVIRGTFLVGNFLPISILGTLILFVLIVNPLLKLFGPRAPLTGKELAVAVGMVLFVCFIPGRGFMHHFTNVLMFPHHYNRTNASWKGETPKIPLGRIIEWRQLANQLKQANADQPKTHADFVKANLSKETIQLIPKNDEAPSQAFQIKIYEDLNGMIGDATLTSIARENELELPDYAMNWLTRPDDLMTEEEKQGVTRAVIDVAFPESIRLRNPGAVPLVPPVMLAEPRLDPNALDGFINGIGEGDKAISIINDIPWIAWRRTLLFWLPLVVTVCLSATGLALVVHRQWSTHEHLPYPTVEFTKMLLPEPGRVLSPLFHNKLFWLGLIPVLVIHLNNLAYAWWPEQLIRVQIRFYFWSFLKLVPTYYRSGIGNWDLFNPTIYFTVIGFAYFLPKDISLSLGLAPFLFGYCTGKLATYGIPLGPAMTRPTINSFCYAGSYIAMFCVLIYTGRRYYSSILRKSFGLKGGDEVEPHAIWGFRAFILGLIAFIILSFQTGLQWQLSLLYGIGLLILLTVTSRMMAEAGVFYLHTNIFPCAILWGFFGMQALGPEQLLIMGLFSCVMFVDPRECFMPFAVESLCLNDQMKTKIGRLATIGVFAIVLGLLIAVPVTLYFQYKEGAIKVGDGWSYGSPPTMAINASLYLRNTLQAQGALKPVDNRSAWQRFGEMKPVKEAVTAFAITFSLVIIFTICRQRLPWWPLHPVLFLTLGTYQSTLFAGSFLVGWVVKHTVTKYGGSRLYQKLKPTMAGLVAGEFLAGVIAIIISVTYYFVTGETPKGFAIYR